MNEKRQSLVLLAIFSFGFIAMGIGTITPAISVTLFIIGEVCLGIGVTFSMSSIYMLAGSSIHPSQTPMAMSIIVSGMNLGGFLSGYFYAAINGTAAYHDFEISILFRDCRIFSHLSILFNSICNEKFYSLYKAL